MNKTDLLGIVFFIIVPLLYFCKITNHMKYFTLVLGRSYEGFIKAYIELPFMNKIFSFAPIPIFGKELSRNDDREINKYLNKGNRSLLFLLGFILATIIVFNQL